ncbi:MAG: hypothetical protein ABIT38_18750 [Gemmatimonadaceae bacterium]
MTVASMDLRFQRMENIRTFTSPFVRLRFRSSSLSTGSDLSMQPPMRPTRRLAVRRLGAVVLIALVAGCPAYSPGARPTTPTDIPVIGEGRQFLFIGNSYLMVHDVPGIIQALADSGGSGPIAVATVAGPDMALIDHWNQGNALRELRKGAWEAVILQQGPSSVEVNRDSLRLLTKRFADEMRPVNARPALFSAWPTEIRRADFDRAIESYRLAANDVGGLQLPVAAAWLAAWRRDASLVLWEPDGLHASTEGAYLAALACYAVLLGRSPIGLPPTLRLRSGAVLSVPPQTARLLQDAAAEAVAALK